MPIAGERERGVNLESWFAGERERGVWRLSLDSRGERGVDLSFFTAQSMGKCGLGRERVVDLVSCPLQGREWCQLGVLVRRGDRERSMAFES